MGTPFPWDQAGYGQVRLGTMVGCFLVGSLGVYIFYLAFLHPLAHIPGPLLGKFTELWKFQHMYQADFSSSLGKLHQQYGSLVRIAPNEVSVLDAAEIPQIYGHGTAFKKSETWYGAWSAHTGRPNHFSDRDSTSHSTRKKAVSHVYSINSLLKLEPYIEKCTFELIDKLSTIADTGEIVDLGKWLHYYAFDVVGELAVGRSFGLLETGEDRVNVLSTIRQVLVFTSIAGQLNSWRPFLYSRLFGGFVTWMSSNSMEKFRSWVNKQVTDRLESDAEESSAETGRTDMLSMFRKATDRTTGQPFTLSRIFNETFTVLGAGSDTTAISLRGFWFYILQNPRSLERLQKEIDEADNAGHLSDAITYAEASKLLYLQACLKESMRLQPAVGMHLPRRVPTGGAIISGQFFPEGSVVGISPKLIHRSPGAYGATANEWDPERWLDERAAQSNRNNLAFGGGPRVCLGKNISLMEMSKLLPELARRFEFRIENPARPWTNEEMWFEVQTDFFVRIKKRVGSS